MSKYIAEFIGTFVFVSVILFSVKALSKTNSPSVVPFAVGLGLVAGIFVCLGAGGDAHLNPAVSSVFLAKGDLSIRAFSGYASCQIAGALFAFLIYKLIGNYSDKRLYSS